VQSFEDLLGALLNGGWRYDEEGNSLYEGPKLVDYSKAPVPVDVNYPEGMEDPRIADFLVNNVDAVLNWVWNVLFVENANGNAWLEGMINDLIDGLPAGIIKPTIGETLDGILGGFLYTPDILDAIWSLVEGLLPMLLEDTLSELLNIDDINITLTINDILKKAFMIDQDGTYVELDLEELFKGFIAHVPGVPFTVGDERDEFVAGLKGLLEPLMPVLRLLLTEGDLLGIVADDVNDGNGLFKIDGANGYETGLLPLLMGIGAQVPGFLETLKTYEEVKADNEALLDAILLPILHLLDALVSDPIGTILVVLPNLAYILLPNADGESILMQALVNLLHPVTSLLDNPMILDLLLGPEGLLTEMLGDVLDEVDLDNLGQSLNALLMKLISETLEFSLGDDMDLSINLRELMELLVVGMPTVFDLDFLTSFGTNLSSLGLEPGLAQFLDVNKGGVLVSLLDALGLFDELEKLEIIPGVKLNLLGLLELLNYNGRVRPTIGPIDYPEPVVNKNPYYSWTWSRRDAVALLDKLPGLLDDLLEMLFGAKLNDYLAGLLGDSLFNGSNFDGIVEGLQGALDLDALNIELFEGVYLFDILGADGAITIGGEPFNIVEKLGELMAYEAPFAKDSNGNSIIPDQNAFVREIVNFLAPVVPLLDFLLFSKDIVILDIEVVGSWEDTTGVLRVFGYEGYTFGLIPILEALLIPLGLGGSILDADTLRNMAPEEKLEKILRPLLDAVDKVIADPLEGLLMLLPSIAYFTTAQHNGKSPLDQSLDNLLFGLTSLVSLLTGEPASLISVLKLFGLEEDWITTGIDVAKLLDDLLFDLTKDKDGKGISGLGTLLLKNLVLGTPGKYISIFSGGEAWALTLNMVEDRADLLTVLLRTVIELIQGDKGNREIIVTMLTNLIIEEGAFGNQALHWGIHFVLWCLRICGTELTLEKFQRLVNWLSWFLPVIRWVMNLFGVIL